MLCEIFSISTLIIIIYLVILVYFIQSLFSKQTKTQRQNLQIKWNNLEEDLVILHQFSRARFCPSPSPYPIKLETFLRMHNIAVEKHDHISINWKWKTCDFHRKIMMLQYRIIFLYLICHP